MLKRTANLRLSIIKQMEMRASKFPDVISLAQGVPSFDTPGCIKRRVVNAMSLGMVARYSLSPGLPELRELIEQELAKEKMYYDWQNEIIITAGTIEAITASILAITEPGDEVILPEPCYTSYREVVELAGCRACFVPMLEEQGWALDFEAIKKAATPKTRALLFSNPGNPTGRVFDRENLLKLGEWANENGIFILSDEVYKDFAFDQEMIFSLAQIPKFRKKVIRMFGFSKSYAMTGWRVGYLHGDEEIVKEILKVHDSLVTCAPVISQYAVMGALEMGENDLKIFKKKYHERKNLICSRLDRLGNLFSYREPQSAYYIFPKIEMKIPPHPNSVDPSSSSWNLALHLLENAQVATVPGIAFGPSGENHLRLSFGKRKRDINRAFDRIEKFANENLF